MLKLSIDQEKIDQGAEDWWRSLDPATRGVYLQALWELQQCPPPRDKEDTSRT